MSPIGAADDEEARVELRRLTDRLATLAPGRLGRPGPDGVTPVGRVRPLLQHLADVAADAERRPRRPVPALAARAVADQLQVLAGDALRSVDAAGAADVHRRLAGLRRSL